GAVPQLRRRAARGHLADALLVLGADARVDVLEGLQAVARVDVHGLGELADLVLEEGGREVQQRLGDAALLDVHLRRRLADVAGLVLGDQHRLRPGLVDRQREQRDAPAGVALRGVVVDADADAGKEALAELDAVADRAPRHARRERDRAAAAGGPDAPPDGRESGRQ